MVSFVCNQCQDTVKKPKLDQHASRCRGASFSCIDCSTDFYGTEYRQHTSCISEAEKYQGALYKNSKKGRDQPKQQQQQQKLPKQQQSQPPSIIAQLSETKITDEPATEDKKRKADSENDKASGKKDKKEKKDKKAKQTTEESTSQMAATLIKANGTDGMSLKTLLKKLRKQLAKDDKTTDKTVMQEKLLEQLVLCMDGDKVTLSLA